jgi:hypothetical protein
VLWIGQAVAFAQVHLVIDVSGNIQRLDPQKQRIAAIKSFINQLPDGTQAGIWTYAKGVNHLVSTGVVNAEWRRKAMQAVNGIGGYGEYSNVGDALAQATYYWRDNKAPKGRNVVLLTDSGVRVSDNAEENAAARKRVLGNLLPAMKQGGVKVYVLAFNKVDASLYQELASATNGSYQAVAKPADLSSAFKAVSSKLALPPARAVKPEPAAAKETTPVEIAPKVEPAPKVEAEPKVEPALKAEEITSAETVEQATPVAPTENVPAKPVAEVKQPEISVTEAEAKPTEQHNHPLKPENLDVKVTETPMDTDFIVESGQITTEVDITANSVKITETETPTASAEQPAVVPVGTENVATTVTITPIAENAPVVAAEGVAPAAVPAETLGAQEAEEIRSALENAEAELSELLTEFAAMPKNDNSATTQVLNGQQSNEPLVITLADGSVLVTPNENKAHEFTTQTAAPTQIITPSNAQGVTSNGETAENVIPNTENKIEWPGTSDETDIWPVILTILVVVNLVVIFLLFIGRYLWLRHKRKTGSKPNNNMY